MNARTTLPMHLVLKMIIFAVVVATPAVASGPRHPFTRSYPRIEQNSIRPSKLTLLKGKGKGWRNREGTPGNVPGNGQLLPMSPLSKKPVPTSQSPRNRPRRFFDSPDAKPPQPPIQSGVQSRVESPPARPPPPATVSTMANNNFKLRKTCVLRQTHGVEENRTVPRSFKNLLTGLVSLVLVVSLPFFFCCFSGINQNMCSSLTTETKRKKTQTGTTLVKRPAKIKRKSIGSEIFFYSFQKGWIYITFLLLVSPPVVEAVCTPWGKDALIEAVNQCLEESSSGNCETFMGSTSVSCGTICTWGYCEPNGPMGNWVITKVKDMSNLFKDKTYFNADISKWYTATVTDMSGSKSTSPVFLLFVVFFPSDPSLTRLFLCFFFSVGSTTASRFWIQCSVLRCYKVQRGHFKVGHCYGDGHVWK